MTCPLNRVNIPRLRSPLNSISFGAGDPFGKA
jgi:hypothetical protein